MFTVVLRRFWRLCLFGLLASIALGARAAAPDVTTINGNPLTIRVGSDTSFQILNAENPGVGQMFPDSAEQTADMGWFIFTTILLFCTLRSTVAFFLLFFFLDIAYLMLGIGYLVRTDGAPTHNLIMAGGFFGFLAAFAAWYNALAGLADNSNSFFIIPVAHFPWSPTGRERRGKTERELA